MSNRFSYVKYNDMSTELWKLFKRKFEELEFEIASFPDGRAKSLVYTKLEEAYMWVGKAIRDEQILRIGKAEEQLERNNE